MNTDRERLLHRRRDLQRRILRDRQQSSIAEVLASLESSGAAYSILWPETESAESWRWIKSRFPIGSARVEWAEVRGSTCTMFQSDSDRDQLFRQRLLEQSADSADEVVIIWGNSAKPAVQTCVSAVHQEHCSVILDADFDTWLYAPAGDWLIECHHEGEICSGRAQLGQLRSLDSAAKGSGG